MLELGDVGTGVAGGEASVHRSLAGEREYRPPGDLCDDAAAVQQLADVNDISGHDRLSAGDADRADGDGLAPGRRQLTGRLHRSP